MTHLLAEMDVTTQLDQAINDFFEISIVEATQIDPSYRYLWETLYGLISSGGKRLRPRMTLMAYEAFGGSDTTKLIPIAVAQELLHFCLLIHDDVIDRDYVRYGTLNIAGRYRTVYSKYVADDNDRTHYAHGAAILGGDLMLSGAHQLIASSNMNDKEKTIAQHQLSRAVFDVAGGELLDTESSFVPYSTGDALKIAQYKTASYTFVSPLLTGALIAGINEKQIESLRMYAHCLGVAYQLVDDLLGVFGDEEKTGKSTSGDIREGKRTFMVEQAYSIMTASEKEVFGKGFGNTGATNDELAAVKQILMTTGARDTSEQMISKYADNAHQALAGMGLSENHKKQFEQLIHKVTERSF